jgi:hypothetical protein
LIFSESIISLEVAGDYLKLIIPNYSWPFPMLRSHYNVETSLLPIIFIREERSCDGFWDRREIDHLTFQLRCYKMLLILGEELSVNLERSEFREIRKGRTGQ